MLSLAMKEMIAGFFDGDGHLKMNWPAGPNHHPAPFVEIPQSYNAGKPPELKSLRDRLGGRIYVDRPAEGNVRKSWKLVNQTVVDVIVIFDILVDHAVLKQPQALLARSYLRDGRENPIDIVERLQQMHNNYQDVEIRRERLTPAYIAGLFMAEGCISLSKTRPGYRSLESSIAQSGCLRLLEALQETIGFGRINDGKLKFACAQTVRFCRMILPYMMPSQKKPQVELALRYVEIRTSNRGHKRTIQETEYEEEIAEQLTKMKKK
jgi:hypothetical protein